jgi:hypothetical protein
MPSDPEVIASSLDGLAIERLAGVAGTQSKGTTAFFGVLRQGRSAAAALGQWMYQVVVRTFTDL